MMFGKTRTARRQAGLKAMQVNDRNNLSKMRELGGVRAGTKK